MTNNNEKKLNTESLTILVAGPTGVGKTKMTQSILGLTSDHLLSMESSRSKVTVQQKICCGQQELSKVTEVILSNKMLESPAQWANSLRKMGNVQNLKRLSPSS